MVQSHNIHWRNFTCCKVINRAKRLKNESETNHQRIHANKIDLQRNKALDIIKRSWRHRIAHPVYIVNLYAYVVYNYFCPHFRRLILIERSVQRGTASIVTDKKK
eukprot:41436_1